MFVNPVYLAFQIIILIVFIHFQLKVFKAKKKLKEVTDQPPSNSMLPENDYGKGDYEKSVLDNLLYYRNSIVGFWLFLTLLPLPWILN